MPRAARVGRPGAEHWPEGSCPGIAPGLTGWIDKRDSRTSSLPSDRLKLLAASREIVPIPLHGPAQARVQIKQRPPAKLAPCFEGAQILVLDLMAGLIAD